MKRLSILTCIALLSGCGSSDLDLVKDGYMDFNQTSTIGQILDNWRSCESSEWAETVESNGVRKVVFSCTHKGFDEFANTLKETIALKDEYFQEYFGVSSTTTQFTFTINQDESFQLASTDMVTNWHDGKRFVQPMPINSIEMAYQDELAFDPAQLDWNNAVSMNRMYATMHSQAQ